MMWDARFGTVIQFLRESTRSAGSIRNWQLHFLQASLPGCQLYESMSNYRGHVGSMMSRRCDRMEAVCKTHETIFRSTRSDSLAGRAYTFSRSRALGPCLFTPLLTLVKIPSDGIWDLCWGIDNPIRLKTGLVRDLFGVEAGVLPSPGLCACCPGTVVGTTGQFDLEKVKERGCSVSWHPAWAGKRFSPLKTGGEVAVGTATGLLEREERAGAVDLTAREKVEAPGASNERDRVSECVRKAKWNEITQGGRSHCIQGEVLRFADEPGIFIVSGGQEDSPLKFGVLVGEATAGSEHRRQLGKSIWLDRRVELHMQIGCGVLEECAGFLLVADRSRARGCWDWWLFCLDNVICTSWVEGEVRKRSSVTLLCATMERLEDGKKEEQYKQGGKTLRNSGLESDIASKVAAEAQPCSMAKHPNVRKRRLQRTIRSEEAREHGINVKAERRDMKKVHCTAKATGHKACLKSAPCHMFWLPSIRSARLCPSANAELSEIKEKGAKNQGVKEI
ncbi:uncharacterized protein EI90DRAFT_3292478 [Cantharellus anzutake]|uniref:uncharacterized protein n=1 Tax=Cantharellus anzutake TaxID=1750568 RepID=UPI00190798BF|nr:uncharacterized protein EI90DRAFT_3292478 [Cantharellus anzutake]KAF8322750.1 hypothetical protein EI90DRAFT_3292478 [Cantharellus anzutake]